MAPDMAYVLNGSRLHVWAHRFPGVFAFCVPVTVLVSLLVVKVLAPVVPDLLADLGEFHLREFRGLAVHNFTPLGLVAGAALGALSHVVLDSFTHEWGWFARHLSWYSDPLGDSRWLGRRWSMFRIVQYLGHVGGSALCVGLLWRYGRQRWMRASAALVEPVPSTLRTHLLLWSCTAAGAIAGISWVYTDSAGVASDVLRVSGTTFAGMCVGAFAVTRLAPAPTA